MKVFTKNSNTNGSSVNAKPAETPFFPVQAKLAIGKANDPYEQQADAMAEQVVSDKRDTTKSEGGAFFSPAPSPASQISPGVQLQPFPGISENSYTAVQQMPFEDVQRSEEEEAQTKLQLMPFEDTGVQTQLQLMPFEDTGVQAKLLAADPVQRMKIGGSRPKPDLGSRINNKKGGGSPLSDPVKTDMESGFGADFKDVKVHTDTESAEMNKELGAKAFTSGNDVFFNQGQFNPESKDGKNLLAHELTHTIQQGASKAKDPQSEQKGEAEPQTGEGGTTASEGGSDAATEAGTETTEGQAVEGEVPTDQAAGDQAAQEGAEGAAAGAESGGGGGGGAVTTTPRSPEEDPNFQQMEGRVDETATGQQDHQEPTAAAGAAQGAAASPANERSSMAEAGQVDAMEEAEAGEFSAEDFKAKLMERIESMQLPASEEEADDFEDNNNIDEVTQAATGDVAAEQAGAAGAIEQTTSQEPNADAVPEREVTPLAEPPIGETPQSVNPDSAMPPSRGRAEVNTPLEQNMSEVDSAQEEAEVTDEMLANSNEPKFTGALDSKKEAKDHTENAPNQLRQQEQGVLQNAQINANNQSADGLNAMHQDRSNALNTVNQDQQSTGQTDTAERERIAGEINTIFERTKTDVEEILADLDTKTTEMFQAGAEVATKRFEDYVERKMDAYKDERYSGLGGALTWVGDAFTGLPDEVNEFFVDGRQVFIDHMDGVITNIAQYVADKLNAAKTRITEGKQEVQDYVTSLPENLQQIGSDAAEEISTKFDELEESVNSKQDELIDNLADQYTEALEAVDARIEEMKAANRGLIDMALGAIMGVIQTIIDIKNMLTELLVGAANAIMTIISDPIGFLSNLFGGIKQGFEQFGSNILTHLQTALIQWLTGALGPVGITMPDDLFSLKGIFSLVAQILGLTWDYIRQKAVKHLGEPVVVALETGFEIFQIIRTQGIDGLWEYLKEQFNDLKETVIDAIKDMVISTVIEAGIKWVLGLLNPASAFVKACMMIIDVVRFFIERGSQIIELVRAFIEGVNAVASGNVTAVANAIENALARALPVIIGFLASLLGISGLARKVTKLIGKIRKRVDKAVEKLIKQAKKAFRGLVKKGKTAVAKAFQWWKKDKKFTAADGKKHRLYFKGEGKNARLMVRSEEQDLQNFLDNYPVAKDDPKKAEKIAAKQSATQILAEITRLKKTKGEAVNSNDDPTPAFKQQLDLLAPKVAIIMESASGEVPNSTPPVYGGLSGGGMGTSTSVEVLTSKIPAGGSPTSAGQNFGSDLDKRKENRASKRRFYKLGHLLSNEMGGPAQMKNLSAQSESGNQTFERGFEKKVKAELKKTGKVAIFKVKVTAVYGGHPGKSGLLTALDDHYQNVETAINGGENDAAKKATDLAKAKANLALKKSIVNEEDNVPKHYEASATSLDNSLKPTNDGQKHSSVNLPSAPYANDIKRDIHSYFVDGQLPIEDTVQQAANAAERVKQREARAASDGTGSSRAISDEKVQQVLKLAGDGLSYRKIAEQTGVSKSKVGTIVKESNN